MFAVPAAIPVSKPVGPTVATPVLSDVQVTSRLITWVLESLKDPVAVSDNLVPAAIVLPAGVIEIETICALVTSTVMEALTDARLAPTDAVPGLSARTSPLLLIFAAGALEVVHVTCEVRSRVLPSLNVPIAAICWLVVAARVRLPGAIAIDARLAALTLAEATPLTAPEAAVIVTVPTFRAVNRPLTVIEAIPVFDEFQAAVAVMSWVVPSENDPVAVNCCRVPSGNDPAWGVTAMEVKLAFVTVNTALAEKLPDAAVILELPGAFALASPPTAFRLIPATEEFADAHCTDEVRFCVLPSVNVPIAENCKVVPWAMDAAEGVIEIEVRVGLVTVRTALEETVPEVALIEVLPIAIPIANPCAPFTLIFANEEFAEVHCTTEVRFCVLPSVNVPVAANCTVVPNAIDGLAGETASDTSAGAVTVSVVLPLTPETAAEMLAEPCALPLATPAFEIVAEAVFEELHVAELVRFLLVLSL
jgi:hypothetical protein